MVPMMPLHPKTLSSLALFISRLVLVFWYGLTQVVLEKRPLNGSNSSSVNCKLLLSEIKAHFGDQKLIPCCDFSDAVHYTM